MLRMNRVRVMRQGSSASWLQRITKRAQGRTDDRSALFILALACAIVVGWVVSLPVGVVVGVALAVNPTRKARSRTRTASKQFERELPIVAGLLAVAIGAGYATSIAIDAVTAATDGTLSDGLADALRRSRSGARLTECLGDLNDVMAPMATPLFDLLISSERDGAPVSEGLACLAASLRRSQSRRSRAAARRLPVLLLAPMTCCVLPAFALLVVAPVLVEGFSSLDTLLPR